MTPNVSDSQLPSRLEPVDRVLVVLILFFTISMVSISKWSPNDGQTFQVLSGGLTTFIGAFVGRMLPNKKTATTETVQK